MEKACRNCRFLTQSNICPECKASNASEDWSGIAVIIDPKNSGIAKKMGIKRAGRYALRVR